MEKQPQRVRLIVEITPELPLGSLGTVNPKILGKSETMVWVKWDSGPAIAMYKQEIEEVRGETRRRKK